MSALLDWILSAGPSSAEDFLAGLCLRIQEAGVPIDRCGTSLLTAHPEILVREYEWQRSGGVRTVEVHRRVHDSPVYRESAIRRLHQGERRLRQRLDGSEPPPFSGLVDLRKEGFHDYVIFAMAQGNGQVSYLSFATRTPEGFRDADLQALENLVPAVGVRFDAYAARHASRSLLQVYLGRAAAERVAAGQVQRGMGTEIEAAVWYSDMRGFTTLGDTLPVRTTVELLDRYFEATGSSIADHGGEILKFIGDAVLAIFRVESGEAATRAVAAAREALENLAQLNVQLARESLPQLGMGLGLHVGRVLFGNIGTRDRLDFTVIGSCVNEASRIESLCKETAHPVLASLAFAQAAGLHQFTSLGPRQLKGVREPVEIFRLETSS